MDVFALIALVVAAYVLIRLLTRQRRADLAPPPPPFGEAADAPGEGGDEVERHLAAGRKIDAIKAYRERHGVGLAEAKEAVERVARQRGPGR